MPRIPDSITEGTATRQEVGRYLENGMTIKTPPANGNYLENFDRVFGRNLIADEYVSAVRDPEIAALRAPDVVLAITPEGEPTELKPAGFEEVKAPVNLSTGPAVYRAVGLGGGDDAKAKLAALLRAAADLVEAL